MSVTASNYKDTAILTKTIVRFLYCVIFLASIYAIELFKIHNALLNESDSVARIFKSSIFVELIRYFETVSFIITGILFLRWLYVANCNTRALGAKKMRFSPGWSIGWFFIPIACLWKPYQAIKEILMTSVNPIACRTDKSILILNYFWFLWIIKLITSLIVVLCPYGMHIGDSLTDHLSHNSIRIISSFINIIFYILIIVIVKRIYSIQSAELQRNQLEIKTLFKSFLNESMIVFIYLLYILFPLSFFLGVLISVSSAILNYLGLMND
jgi:Domain of unknown function (DUF4328)